MRPINCGFRSLKGKASFVNPVNELFSLGYKVQHNLVPRVLSYPPYGARERERDAGKRWSHDSRTELFLREESFVSHSFVWFIRDVHAVIAAAR